MDPIPPQHDITLPLKPNEQKPKLPTALFGLLAYISILFLVPLFLSDKGTFERFHSVQGGVLFVCSAIGLGVSYILGAFIGSILFATVIVLEVALTIIGTRNVLLGLREGLPFLDRIAGLFLHD